MMLPVVPVVLPVVLQVVLPVVLVKSAATVQVASAPRTPRPAAAARRMEPRDRDP